MRWLFVLLFFMAPPAFADDRPDIFFVIADDLDVESMRHFTRLQQMLTDQGAQFSNDFVSLSLCCASRSTMLRGQYAHNHSVYKNNGAEGGFPAFHRLDREAETLAVWLQRAGYWTALFGKYLNGYPESHAKRYIPPGWSQWYAANGGDIYGQYHYRLNQNGWILRYGGRPSDYMVDVIRKKLRKFVSAAKDRPLFAWLAPVSPHSPNTAAPRYVGQFAGEQAPRTPNFGEVDTSDKPAGTRDYRPLDTKAITQIDHMYQERLAAMLAVEDLVADIIEIQTERGRMENTWIVFASDNGFHLGQHGLRHGKETQFDEDLRVPLIVRGPGVQAGSVVTAMTLNTDIAPSLAAMAGVAVPEWVDGRSWLPWLVGPRPTVWRQAILLERGAQPQQEDIEEGEPSHQMKAFVGIRTQTRKLIHWANGALELYNLDVDPYELENQASQNPVDLAPLSDWLTRLQNCAGLTCQENENQ